MAEQNATTQSPNVIGEVKSITGKVVAIGAGGERTLAAGDPVFADDLIKTIGVSTVVITLNDGTRFDLGRDAEGLLDESVYGGDIEVLRAAAVVEAAEIQRAIAEGADPTAVTEPPAAGETTTGSENGGETTATEDTSGPPPDLGDPGEPMPPHYSDEAQADERLQAFIKDFYPELPRFVPGANGPVAGAGG